MAVRIIVIQRNQSGLTVGAVLQSSLRFAKAVVLQYVRGGKVRLAGQLCQAPGRQVRAGQRLEIALVDSKKAVKKQSRDAGGKMPRRGPLGKLEKPVGLRRAARPEVTALAQAIRVRHLDAHVLVVDKPPGLTTVRHASEVEEIGKRAQKFLPPTLVDLLPGVLPANERTGRPRAVHRLDKDTSGLVVLARTGPAETHLGLQFRAHTVEREYLALVRGRARSERIETYLVRDRGDARRGSGDPEGGQKAVTTIEVVEKLGNFTLVACRLETGRTHQVRIHLGEHGTPLCGERVYDRPINGKPVPDTSGAKRPLLHATYLGFDHPATGRRLSWRAKLPKDMDEVLRKLRYQKKKGSAKDS